MPSQMDGPVGEHAEAWTSSANPTRLVGASEVVPGPLGDRLAAVQVGLYDELAAFNRLDQSPELVQVPYELASLADEAVRAGNEIDTFLVRVAAAFFAAGEPTGNALLSCVPPIPVMWVIGNSTLDAELSRWDTAASSPNGPPAMTFEDGRVLGPDGQWYTVVTQPPAGDAPWLGRSPVQTVDFGAPDFWLGATARMILLGLAPPPLYRHAPPEAYEYVGWDQERALVVGPPVADSPPLDPRAPVPTDELWYPTMPRPEGIPDPTLPPPRAGRAAGGAELVQGALAGLSDSAHERHEGVHRVQADFYVDPATGERVAVVDAAEVYYDADGNVVVYHGRLSFEDDPDHPEFVPMHQLEPSWDQETYRPATTITIPTDGES